MKFAPGAAAAGTTDATWTATYVPVGDMGPPEHIKQIAIPGFKALAGVAKANPTVAFVPVVVAALSIFTW